MESKFKNGKIVLLAFTLYIVIIKIKNDLYLNFNYSNSQDKVVHNLISIKSFESGDLIFRYGNGYFSKYFRSISPKDKIYSHVGVICTINDSIFVVHSEASEFTGEGGVIKESIEKFISESSIFDVYRLNATADARCRVEDESLSYLLKAIPFDTKFDFSDTSSFYCTELVAHCVNNALDCNLIQPNKYLGKSAIITLDNIYYNNPSFRKIY